MFEELPLILPQGTQVGASGPIETATIHPAVARPRRTSGRELTEQAEGTVKKNGSSGDRVGGFEGS
jgi:hypothetical protein